MPSISDRVLIIFKPTIPAMQALPIAPIRDMTLKTATVINLKKRRLKVRLKELFSKLNVK